MRSLSTPLALICLLSPLTALVGQKPAGEGPVVPDSAAGRINTAPKVGTPASAAPTAASFAGEPTPYVREIWAYYGVGRSDPMHPPSTLRDGSNLPELTISGILLNPADPSHSRVAVRLRNGERRIVGVGDTIPPFVVTAIEANRVEVKYPQLGGVRRRWIERPKPPAPR